MRVKLTFIALLIVPFAVKAQHSTVFYNKGKMYVGTDYNFTTNGGTTVAGEVKVVQKNTVLAVGGSIGFATGTNVATEDGAVISLTGDLKSLVPTSEATKQGLFYSYRKNKAGATTELAGAKGTIFFNNRETGGEILIPRLASTSAVDPTEVVSDTPVYPGVTKRQTISMTSTDKVKHYMILPELRSQDNAFPTAIGTYVGGFLAVDAGVAMITKSILPSYKGMLLIETKPLAGRKIEFPHIIGSFNAVSDATAATQLKNAQGLGYVVQDIRLYDPSINGKIAAGATALSNVIDHGSDRTEDITVGLTGFTPTSKYWYSDHMLFNVLTSPAGTSFTGWRGPVIDPKFEMKAGQGYFMALNAVPRKNTAVYNEVVTNWNVEPLERAVGGYQFGGRELIMDKITGKSHAAGDFPGTFGKNKFNTVFGTASTINDTYNAPGARPFVMESMGGSGESYETELQKLGQDHVMVELNSGFNYLGNPFTAPLDLKDIIKATPATLNQTDWGQTSAGQQITISPNTNAHLRSAYWVVSDGTVRYMIKDGTPKFIFNAKYNIIQHDAATNDLNGFGTFTVAPMQMFCLMASTPIKFKLRPTKVAFSPVKGTRSGTDERVGPSPDELLIQALIVNETESGDEIIESDDRICVKLKEGATWQSKDPFDAVKGLTNALTEVNNDRAGVALKSVADGVENVQTFAGVIYTKSREGINMLSNIIPASASNIDVYFTPSTKSVKNVRLTPYRMASWELIKDAWLEDKLGDRDNDKSVFTEITEGMVYNTISKPGDQEDRFVVHFNRNAGPVNPLLVEEKPITCYYDNNYLYIRDLIADDMNSDIKVYDMQGRLMMQSAINNVATETMRKSLTQGTYIVKITGKRNFTTKFVTLQN